MKAIEINGLTKKFKSFTAVEPMNLSVEEGELFALLGVNGAGKTTTIRMLSCLSKPTGGDACICGHSIISEENEVKRIINISTQETAIAENLTVEENLRMIAGMYGFGKKQAKQKAREIIEEFSMQKIAKQRSKTLSGGWQRRLSIAMALITEPKVLFLDEPTLGLDVLARRELWSVIEKLKGKVTIVLTTHYLEEAEQLSDRIAVMIKGKIKAIGTADGLKRESGTASLEEAFVKIAQEV